MAGLLWDSKQSRAQRVSVGICALHSPAVLCLVISLCGTVQRIHAGEGIGVPSSHSWPPAKVPSNPPLMSVSSYPPVKASGAGWGPIRVRKRIAGPDTHSPEPFQALVLYFSPCLSMGTSRWMGPFVFRQWGWICLSESKWAGGPPPSRRRHECEPNTTCAWWTSWMLSVPGKRSLTSFSGWFKGGCSACPHPVVSDGFSTEKYIMYMMYNVNDFV